MGRPSSVRPRNQPSGARSIASRKLSEASTPAGTAGMRAMTCFLRSTSAMTQSSRQVLRLQQLAELPEVVRRREHVAHLARIRDRHAHPHGRAAARGAGRDAADDGLPAASPRRRTTRRRPRRSAPACQGIDRVGQLDPVSRGQADVHPGGLGAQHALRSRRGTPRMSSASRRLRARQRLERGDRAAQVGVHRAHRRARAPDGVALDGGALVLHQQPSPRRRRTTATGSSVPATEQVQWDAGHGVMAPLL